MYDTLDVADLQVLPELEPTQDGVELGGGACLLTFCNVLATQCNVIALTIN